MPKKECAKIQVKNSFLLPATFWIKIGAISNLKLLQYKFEIEIRKKILFKSMYKSLCTSVNKENFKNKNR